MSSYQYPPSVLATRAPLRLSWYIAPIAAALYPFSLMGFHHAANGIAAGGGWESWLAAAAALLLAFIPTLYAVLLAIQLGRDPNPSSAQLMARRVALLAAAVPPIYTFSGVIGFLLNWPEFDMAFTLALWGLLTLAIMLAPRSPLPQPKPLPSSGRWRVAHGVAALVAVAYLCLHFSNHMFGWLGVEMHTAVMHKLRAIYRSRIGEPILIASFGFLIVSGVRMAWHLTARRADAIRTLQIAGGVYLVFAVISHLNAVLYFARVHTGIETNWSFAVGDPAGLLKDAWNIRLLPYYLLAVFFVIMHAFCGLRGVILAHGGSRQVADRTLAGGTMLAGLVAILIIMAMCGLRITLA